MAEIQYFSTGAIVYLHPSGDGGANTWVGEDSSQDSNNYLHVVQYTGGATKRVSLDPYSKIGQTYLYENVSGQNERFDMEEMPDFTGYSIRKVEKCIIAYGYTTSNSVITLGNYFNGSNLNSDNFLLSTSGKWELYTHDITGEKPGGTDWKLQNFTGTGHDLRIRSLFGSNEYAYCAACFYRITLVINGQITKYPVSSGDSQDFDVYGTASGYNAVNELTADNWDTYIYDESPGSADVEQTTFKYTVDTSGIYGQDNSVPDIASDITLSINWKSTSSGYGEYRVLVRFSDLSSARSGPIYTFGETEWTAYSSVLGRPGGGDWSPGDINDPDLETGVINLGGYTPNVYHSWHNITIDYEIAQKSDCIALSFCGGFQEKSCKIALSFCAEDEEKFWHDDDYAFRKRVVFPSSHQTYPEGMIYNTWLKTGERKIVATNAYFNEGIQASGASSICYYNQKSYMVYLASPDENSDPTTYLNIYLVVKDCKTGEWGEPIFIHSVGTAYDTHNFGVVLVDQNGYIHIAWAKHDAESYYLRSENPEDTSSFIDPATDTSTPATIFGDMAEQNTYPIFWEVKSLNRIYLGSRGGTADNAKWKFFYTGDAGETWNGPYFALHDNQSNAFRAYCQGLVYDEMRERLHLAWSFTIGSIGSEYTPGVFYAYAPLDTSYSAGFSNFYDAGGNWVGRVDSSESSWYPCPRFLVKHFYPIEDVDVNEWFPSQPGADQYEMINDTAYMDYDKVAESYIKGHIIISTPDTRFALTEWDLDTSTYIKDVKASVYSSGEATGSIRFYIQVGDTSDTIGTISLDGTKNTDFYSSIDSPLTGDFAGWKPEDFARLKFGFVLNGDVNTDAWVYQANLKVIHHNKRQQFSSPYVIESTSDADGMSKFLIDLFLDRNGTPWTTISHATPNPASYGAIMIDVAKWDSGNGRWDITELSKDYPTYPRSCMGRTGVQGVADSDNNIHIFAVTSGEDSAIDSEYFAFEIVEFVTKDNGASYSYELLSENSGIGIPILSVKKYMDNNQIEVCWVSGNNIFYYTENLQYGRMLNSGKDCKVYFGGTEIDRISNFWNLDSSCVTFKLQTQVDEDATSLPGSHYYIYYGNQNEDTNPKADPNNIYSIYESFEGYEPGYYLDTTSALWTCSVSGQATVWSFPPNHSNAVFAGKHSIRMAEGGRATLAVDDNGITPAYVHGSMFLDDNFAEGQFTSIEIVDTGTDGRFGVGGSQDNSYYCTTEGWILASTNAFPGQVYHEIEMYSSSGGICAFLDGATVCSGVKARVGKINTLNVRSHDGASIKFDDIRIGVRIGTL